MDEGFGQILTFSLCSNLRKLFCLCSQQKRLTNLTMTLLKVFYKFGFIRNSTQSTVRCKVRGLQDVLFDSRIGLLLVLIKMHNTLKCYMHWALQRLKWVLLLLEGRQAIQSQDCLVKKG